jgi:hypothetical protein
LLNKAAETSLIVHVVELWHSKVETISELSYFIKRMLYECIHVTDRKQIYLSLRIVDDYLVIRRYKLKGVALVCKDIRELTETRQRKYGLKEFAKSLVRTYAVKLCLKCIDSRISCNSPLAIVKEYTDNRTINFFCRYRSIPVDVGCKPFSKVKEFFERHSNNLPSSLFKN